MIECPNCKWNNSDNAVRCANCNAEMRSQQAPPPPPQQPTAQGQQHTPQQYPSQQAQQPYGQQPYGQQPGYPSPAMSVPDNLIWSIVVTILCCPILGIVSIVKAAEANSRKAAGDYYGAMASVNASKMWMYWAIGLGLAANVLGGMLLFFSALRGMSP